MVNCSSLGWCLYPIARIIWPELTRPESHPNPINQFLIRSGCVSLFKKGHFHIYPTKSWKFHIYPNDDLKALYTMHSMVVFWVYLKLMLKRGGDMKLSLFFFLFRIKLKIIDHGRRTEKQIKLDRPNRIECIFPWFTRFSYSVLGQFRSDSLLSKTGHYVLLDSIEPTNWDLDLDMTF